MDEETVREHAQALCAALLAGDIGLASQDMSPELSSHLGSIVAMLPLPLREATIERIEMTGTAHNAVLRLTGEGGEAMRLETRWKERAGRPMIVETSRLAEEPATPGTPGGEPDPG